MNIRKILVAAMAATIVMTGPALAGSIPIVNYSFESPAQGYGGYVGGATGWVANNSGVWYPYSSQLSQGPTDGLQVAWSNGGSLSQTLTSVLTANTQYTLNVDLLNRTDGLINISSTVELLAGSNVLGSSTVTGGIGGTNVLQTVSFFSGVSPYVGQNLGIALISGGGQSDWDNVRLTSVAAVPEPESYAMMLAGLGLLGFMVRRKKIA